MGGLEYNVWDYMIDRPVTGDDRRRGMCQDSDYPYTGIDVGCERTTTHEKAYGITGWQRAAQNVAAIKEAIQDKPAAIGINASCSAFMYYTSGMITATQCPQTNMDHSVVLVGWYGAGDDSNPEPNPNPDPNPDPNPEPSPNPPNC